MICICDWEADVFELFDEQRRHPRIALLVRAKHDRVLGENKPKLFATMSGGAPEGRMTIETDGLVARPKLSGNKERPARTRRLASCEVRFRHVTLPVTVKRADPISLRSVHIVETALP